MAKATEVAIQLKRRKEGILKCHLQIDRNRWHCTVLNSQSQYKPRIILKKKLLGYIAMFRECITVMNFQTRNPLFSKL